MLVAQRASQESLQLWAD